MKHLTTTWILLILFSLLLKGCGNRLEEKGFAVASTEGTETDNDGISKDALTFSTRPSNVLLTGVPRYRLATIYKVNYNKDSVAFIGSNQYHYYYDDDEDDGNAWHGNYMPGLESVYGYNLVDVSLYDTELQKFRNFFDKPVLIKTLYYPSFSKDTLDYKPVNRNYYMVSAYDDDTNRDGFINVRDLRRLYHFDINANSKRALIPTNYSVYKSEYDPANDLMYVFAHLDQNANGKIDAEEVTHIFWIDLKNPEKTGRQY